MTKTALITASTVLLSVSSAATAAAAPITFINTCQGEMELELAGSGRATIDWGDNTAIETVTLKPLDDKGDTNYNHLISHNYVKQGAKTVTIAGDITGIRIAGGAGSTCRVTSLDVSAMTGLRALGCVGMGLSSIGVSRNTELRILTVSSNALTTLDVSRNVDLEVLDCMSNGLTSLDIKGLARLNYVDISDNRLDAGAIKAILAALPDRTGKTERAMILCDPYSPQESRDYGYGPHNPGWASITEADRKVATDKNWRLHGYAAPR
jgi:hypothetical protein